MSLTDDLLRNLETWGVGLSGPIDAQAELISSGRLDSVALYSLSVWIEEQTGRVLDPTTVNIAAEWDSVEKVVAYIERTRGTATAPAELASREKPATVRAAPREVHVEGYRIERSTSATRAAVIGLMRRLWSSDPELNAQFFAWRYEDNPFASDPLIYVASKDGEVVATRALCGAHWEGGGREWTWYFADDLVVLPGHENHGLFAAFTELMRADLAARGADFFLSLSALRVTRLQSLAGGARNVGALLPVACQTMSSKLVDSARDIASRLPLAWRLAGQIGSKEAARRAFERFDAAAGANTSIDAIRAGAVRPAEMAALVQRLGYDGRIRMVRDVRYFQWRFACPLHEYRFLFAQGSNGLDGYLVLERSLSDLGNSTRINIADWEGTTPEVLRALLLRVLEWARPEELVTWIETLGPARVRSLLDNGFVPTDQEQTARGLPSILVWPLELDAPERLKAGDRSLLTLQDWDLRMAYTSLA